MWKLLRNSVLAALLVAGLLKLVLWYEIQQGAARLAAQLAPVAQFQYGSVNAAFSGIVGFDGVSVTFGKGAGRQTWRAGSVEVGTPGALWLARRLLLGDDSMPERLGVTVRGLQAPPAAFEPMAAWLSPLSMVPFETLGCGVVSRFSVADYQRMGLNPGAQQQHVDYRLDPASGALALTAELRSPPFSTITLRTELPKFDAAALASGQWGKLHVGELGVGYVDGGYFAKRNRFCAQQAGVSPAQFVDQHVAAVKGFLDNRGVQLGSEIETVYRGLVGEGGRASVLSLPTAAPTVAQLLAESPEAMTRRLNLTARRNDSPPVMVRLAFKTLPAAENAEPAVAAVEVRPAPSAQPPAPPAVATTTTPAPAPAAAPSVAAPAVAAVQATAHPAASAAKPPPIAATTGAPVVATPARAAPGMPAKAPAPAVASNPPAKAPAPAVVSAPAAAPTAASRNPSATNLAAAETHAAKADPGATAPRPALPADPAAPAPSTPAPPPDSTLALVWKPTVERLQQAPPPERDYEVVEYSALSGYAGRYVRLLTTAGKKVEGRIIAVDSTAVGLRIQRPGGSAELQVPRNIIFEIQLPRARAAAGNSG